MHFNHIQASTLAVCVFSKCSAAIIYCEPTYRSWTVFAHALGPSWAPCAFGLCGRTLLWFMDVHGWLAYAGATERMCLINWAHMPLWNWFVCVLITVDVYQCYSRGNTLIALETKSSPISTLIVHQKNCDNRQSTYLDQYKYIYINTISTQFRKLQFSRVAEHWIGFVWI